MRIDTELIAYLENLSYLTLSEEEKLRLTGDLQDILNGMARLGELDTTGVSERSHPFDNINSFRDDEIKSSLDRALILQNAPRKNDETFIAPSAVE